MKKQKYRLIRRQMFELGVEQRDLAVAAGCSKTHISDWLHGKAQLRMDEIPPIAAVLELGAELLPVAFWPEIYGAAETEPAHRNLRVIG